ncbi:cyclic GMP-AMP synthase-like [Asterias rubens]|uniref:cyclic GMP-AMP synthase-like n=1 Tax=Asterias rubens TaxID=7604 RepID=UPI0014558A06|nr:cyclic GMP-AMP synthase-like [Asterias rubens]XP_033634490.1 cyclic GMP-AMP synthase-like [Asterias rubens]
MSTQYLDKSGLCFLHGRRWDESPAASQPSGCIKGNTSIREALQDFYTRKVEVPEHIAELRKAKLDQILPGLLARVQRNTSRVRCLDAIYVGSTVEDLVIRGHADYNVIVPLSVVGTITPVSAGKPEQFVLRLPRLFNIKEVNEDRWAGWRGERNFLCPTLANKMFLKFIKKWHEVRQHSDTVVITNSGVKTSPVRVVTSLGADATNENTAVTIEIIPGIVLGKKSADTRRLFIAKDFCGKEVSATDDPVWTQVSYESERALLLKVNRADGSCRARALKIFKTLRSKDDTLAHLTSYQMKHALLHLCDEQVDQSRWQRRTIEHCFAEILCKLTDFISRRELPHFFVSNLNLLEDIPERTLAKVESRLRVLSKREKELGRLLSKE